MKNIFLIILISNFIFNEVQSIEAKIIHRIQNEIITSIDIKNQFKYLLALNNRLKELDKEKILGVSNESIIREKVKKIEISKNYKKIEIDKKYLDVLLKNTYSRLSLASIEEFELYLKSYDLTLMDIKKKLTIDALWNELIFQKYSQQISINEENIRKKILKSEKIKSYEYRMSEIIFNVKNKNEIENKYQDITKSINEIGFKNSSSIYSIAETAKIGGDIGWINKNSLNSKIKSNFANLKIGEVSKPIILSNGILILKIMDVRNSEINIDVETELKSAINYEKNRQLSQYSQIYYNKVKKNLGFNE